jgi:hypothetical protein
VFTGDMMFASFTALLLLLLAALIPISGFILFRRSMNRDNVPDTQIIKVTDQSTSWSFGHEAKVLVFPCTMFDIEHAMRLRHKYLSPCIGFESQNAVFAVPDTYHTLVGLLSTDNIFQGQLIKWCQQISTGIAYLHAQNVIHGNLTVDSVLIASGKGRAFLVDYLSSDRLATHAWRPFDTEVSRSTDSWDLGWVIWMTLHGGSHPMTPESRSKSNLPKESENLHGDLYAYTSACWSIDPLQRPTPEQLILVLQDAAEERYASEDNSIGVVWNE